MSHWTGRHRKAALNGRVNPNGGLNPRPMPPGAVFNPPVNPWKGGILPEVDPVTRRLLVNTDEAALESVMIYQENTAVPYDTETTIFTHTVTVLTLLMDSLNMGGSWDGIFRVYLNSVLKMQKRTTAAQRTAEHYFSPDFRLPVGDIVEVTVVHDHAAGSRKFNVTLTGHKGSS